MALRYTPWLAPLEGTFTVFRFAIASIVLTFALFVAHKWLPAGRRSSIQILPGIVATLLLWLAAGVAFGRYLAEFSFTYVNTYAGLASAMIALVFLYWTASIFARPHQSNPGHRSCCLMARSGKLRRTFCCAPCRGSSPL